MNNRDLLETHRKKIAFLIAAFVFVFVYMSIGIFQWFLVYTGREKVEDIFPFWIFLALVAPVFYSFLAYWGCRLMHRVYQPIRDSITNLEQFTTNVNHEFKTSLSEIISSLELEKIT